jgi:tetratricopeptide (TPR) repeat protein
MNDRYRQTKLLLLAASLLLASPASAQVKAWQASIDLPTDEEGPPDVNPPFDLFAAGRFNYPYTLRYALTGKQSVVRHRTLNLENEHLRVVVLPDQGGHLYTCVDKATGAEMFYANRSLRKAQIAYRGVWSAFGIEFNFPVSHNWVSLSPVDFALTRSPDGSASIWVANVDRVYGMQWRVELRLRPGSALLEQHVALYNPGAVRRRFYWWNNAGVRVHDDSRIAYPMRNTASHGFREVDTWPVDSKGVDLSVVGNHLYGPVSLFAHGSREPFMGVWHPSSRTGVVHYSSREDAPTKKIWSWSADADGLDWRKALSDDSSAYVEVQAGLFRNQETYGFLGPQETIRFAEYWMPVREIGGISRANPEAVVHLARSPVKDGAVDLAVGVNVNNPVAGGRLRITDGARTVAEERLDLTPAGALVRSFPGLPSAARYTLTLEAADGRVLLAHTEDGYDTLPPGEITLGPQPVTSYPPPEKRSEGDFVDLGREQEREGKRLIALEAYADGRRRFPESFGLLKAAGRMLVDLQRFAEAIPLLERALERASNDAEVQYLLGLAYGAEGRESRARTQWEDASHSSTFRAAARLELSRLDARAGRREAALTRLRAVVAETPDSIRAGGLEVALLRAMGRADEARARLAPLLARDPTSALPRHEAVKLGEPGEPLWLHLAGEPDRVLGLATEYMGLGLWADAVELLQRRYPAAEGLAAEPGMPLPQDHPLVAYYRGYCSEKAGGAPAADFAAAAALSTRYVFPSRAGTFPVLRRALEVNPQDATAHFLLGSLLLAGGRAEAAVAEWQEARRLNPKIPVLHRNLGLTLLQVTHDPQAALSVLSEGVGADASNVALYYGADQAAGVVGLPAEERLRLLERFPDKGAMPPLLVQKLALGLTEVGRGQEAEAMFQGRFFPREEGGTNVRQVFLEVRLRRAQALAKAGRHAEAAAIVRAIDRPVKGLAFTRDGLAPFLETSRLQYLMGEILAAAGQEAEARRHWDRAVEGRDPPFLKAIYAPLAERRLGRGEDGAVRARREKALADVEALLAQGTNFPGLPTYAQGLLLRTLGRDDEAGKVLRGVFLLPDQRLSHFLARRALEAADPI